MRETEFLEQNNSLQIEFLQDAFNLGISKCYFLEPRTYTLDPNPHRLILNPFEACSNARCLIALLQSYEPIALDHSTSVPFSAYYIASNQLYHNAQTLAGMLNERGFCAQRIEIPAKTALLSAGIGEMGKNTLLSVADLGTRFAIQWIITDAFLPIEDFADSKEQHPKCSQCKRCENICPGKAIDEHGFHETKCMRYYMDGQVMPNWVKENIPSLFGCELCQMVCPRNDHCLVKPMPTEWADMFQFDKLLSQTPENKRWYAQLVGKNMLSRGRLRAQSFALAWRFKPEVAQLWRNDLIEKNIQLTDCERDAMRI